MSDSKQFQCLKGPEFSYIIVFVQAVWFGRIMGWFTKRWLEETLVREEWVARFGNLCWFHKQLQDVLDIPRIFKKTTVSDPAISKRRWFQTPRYLKDDGLGSQDITKATVSMKPSPLTSPGNLLGKKWMDGLVNYERVTFGKLANWLG